MPPDESELPAGLRPRWKVGPLIASVAVAFVALAVGSLFMPVCDPIPDRDLPAFETVMSLERRAAQGEPFKKKGDHWYQCKSALARAMFF
jgi:hypothetical protein